MIKIGLIGIGKMGVSHLAILGAHRQVEVAGVCDTSKMTLQFLEKYSKFPCFTDYKTMISKVKPDAVFVAVPTKFHYEVVKDLLQQDIHVFCEKPFCLTVNQGTELVKIATPSLTPQKHPDSSPMTTDKHLAESKTNTATKIYLHPDKYKYRCKFTTDK